MMMCPRARLAGALSEECAGFRVQQAWAESAFVQALSSQPLAPDMAPCTKKAQVFLLRPSISELVDIHELEDSALASI
jgi:hypothetical protein